MKIQTKVIFVVIILALILLSAGFIVLRSANRILVDKVGDEISNIVSLKVRSLEIFFEETEAIGNLFEKSEFTQEYISLLGEIRDTEQEVQFDNVSKKVDDLLYTLQEYNWGKYHHIFLIDQTEHIVLSPNHGENVKGSPSSHFGEDTIGNIWAHDALKEGVIKISDYSSWSESDHAHQMMFIPVKEDNTGETKAVLGFELQIPHELTIVSEGIDLRETAKLRLFTLDGRSITYNSSENTTINNSTGIKEAAEKGKFIGLIKNNEGTDVLGVYFRHDIYPWILSFEIDATEVFRDLKVIKDRIKTSVSVAVMTIALLMYIFTKSLTVQIYRLVGVASALSKGDLHVRSHNKSKDEMGVLSEAFNSMANTILESQSTLQQKIEEKTKDLSKALKKSENISLTYEKANKLMTGRELKMIELKKEIEDLKNKPSKR